MAKQTAEQAEYEVKGARQCGVYREGGFHYCTRRQGHAGDHVMHFRDGGVQGQWTDAETEAAEQERGSA